MKKIVEKINQEINDGLEFTRPSQTEIERRRVYCVNNKCDYCVNCNMVNYGRDCKNNKVMDDVNKDTMHRSTSPDLH